MSENRMRRVAEQIKKDLSQIIGAEIKDPRVTEITSVTEVQLSRDLRYASVYVSVYGTDFEKEKTLAALTGAAGFIRGEIGRRIRLRHTPEFKFYLDNSIEYGAHIDNVIKSLNKDENSNDDGSANNT